MTLIVFYKKFHFHLSKMTPFYEILLSNLILDMLITFFLKRLKLKKAEQIKKESPLIIDPKENELNEKSIKLKNLKETFSSQIIEAEKLNAPRTFAQFSKMQRKNNILQDEISKLDEEISKIKQEITILEQPLLKEESNGDLLDQLEAKYFFNMKVLKYFLVMVLYLFYKKDIIY